MSRTDCWAVGPYGFVGSPTMLQNVVPSARTESTGTSSSHRIPLARAQRTSSLLLAVVVQLLFNRLLGGRQLKIETALESSSITLLIETVYRWHGGIMERRRLARPGRNERGCAERAVRRYLHEEQQLLGGPVLRLDRGAVSACSSLNQLLRSYGHAWSLGSGSNAAARVGPPTVMRTSCKPCAARRQAPAGRWAVSSRAPPRPTKRCAGAGAVGPLVDE